jgi:4-hydroxy 2-oxovalerate aldolase
VIQFIEKHMVKMRQECVWGYDIPYLLSGILNQHPKDAISFLKEHRTDYTNFYKEQFEKL